MSGIHRPAHRLATARLVTRQVSELLLGRGNRFAKAARVERLPAIIFEVVSGASIAHLPLRDPGTGAWIDLDTAAALGRPVTSAGVAQSMGIPLTTVRRHAAGLIDAGLLVRAAGFKIAPGVLADGWYARLAEEDHADLKRTFAALAEARLPSALAAAAAIDSVPAGVAQRLFLTFALRVLETFARLYGDVNGATINAAIVAANVRHVTRDPHLSSLYAGEDVPPPDALRVPIALRALAREVQLPFETVRRRVAALVAEGLVEWKEGGVIVPTRVLTSEVHRENNRRICAHFDQMAAALAALDRP